MEMGNLLLAEPDKTQEILEENVEKRLKQAEEFIEHLHQQDQLQQQQNQEKQLALKNEKQITEIISILVQNEIITSDDALKINCL